MCESLVNREGDKLAEKRKGREETPNWSRRKDGNNTRMGSEPPNELDFPFIKCMHPG
jgi:hypothetical protein